MRENLTERTWSVSEAQRENTRERVYEAVFSLTTCSVSAFSLTVFSLATATCADTSLRHMLT